jgi:hypothetical protein
MGDGSDLLECLGDVSQPGLLEGFFGLSDNAHWINPLIRALDRLLG